MKILHKRKRVEESTFTLSFGWKELPSAGYGFPCDEDGNLLKPEKHRSRVVECVNDERLIFEGIEEYFNRYTEDAVGECDTCKSKVYLTGFTNVCAKCGAFYNGSGQRLSDPSTWGEETGEHPADTLRIP